MERHQSYIYQRGMAAWVAVRVTGQTGPPPHRIGTAPLFNARCRGRVLTSSLKKEGERHDPSTPKRMI